MLPTLEARVRFIVKRYLSGDIELKEDCIFQVQEFVEDYYRSYPRQAEDTTNMDWEALVDEHIKEIQDEQRFDY